MKKILLSMVAAAALLSANAQQRLVLYEEFSGENCGPCAAYNPGLMTLLNANASKAILIKYQSPIPSAGPIYYQNTTDVSARLSYYGVNSAPTGLLDGGNSDNIANHNQADIDAAYNVPTPFNITATHMISSDWDSIYITVTVTTTGAFSGAQMKLRTALVEHLEYDNPPGSNGETDFHNVMRKMYPDANGTTVPNTWTIGQTQTYTIGGVLPAYVDKSRPIFVIAWLQNDGTKVVAQAAKSAPVATVPLDVMSDEVTIPSSFVCASTTASVVPSVVIKNTGTTPLTSANIYTKVDVSGTWTLAQAWTGNLAAGASATVALPALNVPTGSHFILDSVALPNTVVDINPVNNFSYKSLVVVSTAPNALNISTGFENAGTLPANYVMYDANANGANWRLVWSGTSTNVGHNNSVWLIQHNNYGYPAGEANYAIIPTPDFSSIPIRSLDFWVAYAQYSNENDRLDVVWSNNCGQTWTSVWNKSGSPLSTSPPVGNNTQFVPSQSQWRQESVDMTNVPSGAMIAFKATSDFGNNLYIDDINLRSGFPLGVEAFSATNADMRLFPNPSTDKATLSFSLASSTNVQVSVVDALGRTVATVANSNMDKGQQKVEISTANYASGVYNVIVKTDAGTVTQRLTVTK